MSELAKLTAAANASVFAANELSRFTFRMLAQAEEEFEQRHLRTAATAAADSPDAMAKLLLQIADDDIQEGKFAYGSRGFDAKAKSLANLPFLLWVSLKAKKTDLTLADAEKLITPENEYRVYWAVMEQMGYRKPGQGEEPPPKKSGAAAPPVGSPSFAPPPSEVSAQMSSAT